VKNVTGQYRGAGSRKAAVKSTPCPRKETPRHDMAGTQGEGMETVTDRLRFPATLPIKDLADTIFP
jgi:hypothetical protein